jgi:hypothetical protein
MSDFVRQPFSLLLVREEGGRVMIQYYFHLSTTTDDLIEDQEGADFPNLDSARQEALMAARELVADAVQTGRELSTDAIIIEDDNGRQLDQVKLLAVLPRSLRG